MKIPDAVKEWITFIGPNGPLGQAGTWLWALLLILLGYFVAKMIKTGVRKLLNRTSLDDKIASLLGQDTDGCERAIATFVFWLVMLFVIVMALTLVGQEKTVEPLKGIYDQILGFIPRLLAAGAIGFIAWIIATVVKNVLVSILSASKVDERVGLGESKPITNGVGLIAFFGIILMMLPNALTALQMNDISKPIAEMVGQIFSYIPKLFSGIILFAIGYLVASIVQKVLLGILSSIGTDDLPSKLGYKGSLFGNKSLSEILSYVAMATILVVIGTQSIRLLGFNLISDLAEGFIPGYFRILVALVIFAVAFFVANLVGQLIEGKSQFWARFVRIAIIVFMVGVALQKANISNLTNETFQLIVTCLIVAAAFAAGVGGAIAIGLGGKDKARGLLEKIK